LFEADPQTARIVSEMLLDLEKNGMDAVRKYSGKFDEWNPENFELSDREIEKIIAGLPEQLVRDTDYCQGNVRRFAQAQLKTLLPLEVEIRPESCSATSISRSTPPAVIFPAVVTRCLVQRR